MVSKKKDIIKLILNFFTRFFKYKEIFKIISLAVLFLFIFKDFAWAAGENVGAKNIDDFLNTIVEGLNIVLAVLAFLMTPLIMLAGWLLSPDWTYGEVFSLREIFHGLWTLVSNIVYVVFAIMLIAIAFMNIFSDSKNYALKDNLPKILIGILIVPFTWFIVSAVLSVSNVLTASVIRLPVDTIKKISVASGDSFMTTPVIPRNITYNIFASGGTSSFAGTDDCVKDKTKCMDIETFLAGGNTTGAYNLLSVYAYGIFKIQDYKNIDSKGLAAGLAKVGDLVKRGIFSVIFFTVFGVLVIAIVLALFYRAVVLWMFIIFSPLFALFYFLAGKPGEAFKKIEGYFSITKFISLAMVPVYVSAALAFGLMFVSAAINGKSSGDTPGECGTKSAVMQIKCPDEKTGKQEFKFGEITLTTIGVLTKDGVAIGNTALNAGKGIIGTIIINVLALAILWLAVMAALQSNKITSAAVDPIAKFGTEMGKLALSAPKYIPIPMPGTGGKGISMEGLKSISGTIQSALQTSASSQGQALGEKFSEALGIKTGQLIKDLQNLENNIGGAKSPQAQAGLIAKAVSSFSNNTELNANKEQMIPVFSRVLTKIEMDAKEKTNLQKKLDSKDIEGFIKDIHEYYRIKGTPIGGYNEKIGSTDDLNRFLEHNHSSGGSSSSNTKITNATTKPDDIKISPDKTKVTATVGGNYNNGNKDPITVNINIAELKNPNDVPGIKLAIANEFQKERIEYADNNSAVNELAGKIKQAIEERNNTTPPVPPAPTKGTTTKT